MFVVLVRIFSIDINICYFMQKIMNYSFALLPILKHKTSSIY